MLTESELGRLLADAALEAGPARPDLLARSRKRASRLRHRRLCRQMLGVTAAVATVALIASTVSAGGHTAGRPAQLVPAASGPVASVPTVVPTMPTMPTVVPKGRKGPVLSSTDGLTGSLCDDPGSALPLNYLSWPCVTPKPGTAANLLAGVWNDLNTNYVNVVAPRVRLIASDSTHGLSQVFEFWDQANPQTPTVLRVAHPGDTPVLAAPKGNPTLIGASDAGVVVTDDADIATVRLEPDGSSYPVAHGIATIPDSEYTKANTVIALDRAGNPTGQPAPYATGHHGFTSCGATPGVGTCEDALTAVALAKMPAPTDLCDTPAGSPPPHYLDWPCATPKDASTARRVQFAVAEVAALNRGFAEPRVRLLIDTRTLTGVRSGPDLTVVEVWDAAGDGPPVISSATSEPGTGTITGGDGGPTPVGDPAMVLDSVQSGGQLVFARDGITRVTHDNGVNTVNAPVTNGVAVLPGTAPQLHRTGIQDAGTVTGVDTAGHQVAQIPWAPAYVDPCDAIISSTCVPTDAVPSFGK